MRKTDTSYIELLEVLNNISSSAKSIEQKLKEMNNLIKKVSLYPEDLKAFQNMINQLSDIISQMTDNMIKSDKFVSTVPGWLKAKQ